MKFLTVQKSGAKRSRQTGAAMVELAIASVSFLLLIIGASQLAQYMYRSVALNYVATNTMRWAVLGQSIGTLSRVESIKQIAIQKGQLYKLGLSTSNIRVCPISDPSCTTESAGTIGTGSATDWFTISITTPMRILFGGIQVAPSARAKGVNEP